MLGMTYFVRNKGMKKEIVIQTDNGSEFGGVSVDKIEYLDRMIFAPLCAKLIHIPKGKKEFNAYVERSHGTDDNEFYIPQLERCNDLKELMFRALRWEWFYNTKRIHSVLKSTPYNYLKKLIDIPKSVALFPVVILDNTIDLLDTVCRSYPDQYISANDLLLIPKFLHQELSVREERLHMRAWRGVGWFFGFLWPVCDSKFDIYRNFRGNCRVFRYAARVIFASFKDFSHHPL